MIITPEAVNNVKKIILWLVGILVVIAWASLLVGMRLDIDRNLWIAWVTAVALITEIAIWIVAAVLGVAVFQARKAIWKWMTSPFRRQ